MIEPDQNHLHGELTRDSLFDGRLVCLQHRRGYRFSIDAVLVAHFHPPARGAAVLDLGAGCGIISLIMLFRWGQRIGRLTALEVQSGLAELARMNVGNNGFGEKCHVLHADLREIRNSLAPETFSQVVCNPPFYRQGTGRQSASLEALHARHQILADLGDFVRAAAHVLKNGGILAMIYPAEGLAEMAACFSANGLEMKRLRFVYSSPDPAEYARLVLVQAVKKAGPGVRVMPPLYIYGGKKGCYSPEMQLLYQEHPLPESAIRTIAAGDTR